MRKKLFTILACTTMSCFAQTNKVGIPNTVPFAYRWNVSDAALHIEFANSRFVWSTRITPSTDPIGSWNTSCMQDYLELVVILKTFGSKPEHTDYFTRTIPGLKVYLQPNHPYVLLVDDFNRVWKMTKAEALLFASAIYQENLFNQLIVCGCE